MAKITLQNNPIETIGELPKISTNPPPFTLTKTDLSDCALQDFSGKMVVLNIFPSIDTGVCAASVRRFNQEVSSFRHTVVLCISADLPFAHKRFCESEGLNDVIPLSVFRSPDFGKEYGVIITSGALAGLLARAIVIIDKSGKVIYTEQVPEITQDPDFETALRVITQKAE
ncbi:MAG: thiol peroxidase [Proteobacteria bacterium]|nr:thiol peroxidase [Pseudomonadota bacterium]MBU1716700.1 thiol peroxidase [Pseudomonadota bacterium]